MGSPKARTYYGCNWCLVTWPSISLIPLDFVDLVARNLHVDLSASGRAKNCNHNSIHDEQHRRREKLGNLYWILVRPERKGLQVWKCVLTNIGHFDLWLRCHWERLIGPHVIWRAALTAIRPDNSWDSSNLERIRSNDDRSLFIVATINKTFLLDRTEGWLLCHFNDSLGGLPTPLFVCTAYVLFAVKIGPSFMENR